MLLALQALCSYFTIDAHTGAMSTDALAKELRAAHTPHPVTGALLEGRSNAAEAPHAATDSSNSQQQHNTAAAAAAAAAADAKLRSLTDQLLRKQKLADDLACERYA